MVRPGEETGHPSAQLLPGGQPRVEFRDVTFQGGAQVPGRIVEDRGDVGEREPEPAEQADPVQPRDVARRVQAVATRAAAGRREQADVLVVVQRSDGQARCGCQLADLAPSVASHGPDATT